MSDVGQSDLDLGYFGPGQDFKLNQFLWCGNCQCNAWGPLSSGAVWSARVFGWMVCVKWYSLKCQDPGPPGKILCCSEMINFSCFIVSSMFELYYTM